jgi:hypothetical protein
MNPAHFMGWMNRTNYGILNFVTFLSFVVNIVYFADIQLNPEKLRNSQILLVLRVSICY